MKLTTINELQIGDWFSFEKESEASIFVITVGIHDKQDRVTCKYVALQNKLYTTSQDLYALKEYKVYNMNNHPLNKRAIWNQQLKELLDSEC